MGEATTSTIANELLKASDLGAGVAAAINTWVYGAKGAGMEFARSTAISMVARYATSMVPNFGSMSQEGKNQVVVAILGAALASYEKKSPARQAITRVQADLLGSEILKLTGMNDSVIFPWVNQAPPS